MYYIKAAFFLMYVVKITQMQQKKHKCVLIHFLCDAPASRKPCSQTSVSTCNIVGNVPYIYIRCFDHQEILPYQVVEICEDRSFLYTMHHCYTHICILFTLHHFPYKYIFAHHIELVKIL